MADETPMSSLPQGPESYQDYRWGESLGQGSDGRTHRFISNADDRKVVVKDAISRKYSAGIDAEIKIFRLLGLHPQIVEVIFWIREWEQHTPAVVMEHADHGDGSRYRRLLTENFQKRMPEVTIWKYFADMVKGLDHMHNGLLDHGGKNARVFVHADMKPMNTLAFDPKDHTSDDVSPYADFKICDLGRMVPFGTQQAYNGMAAFAPRLAEREHDIAPTHDIFGLGGSIQYMATGKFPIIEVADFIKEFPQNHPSKAHNMPSAEEARQDYAWDFAPLFRDINQPVINTETKQTYEPFSNGLNAWYKLLMHDNLVERITSEDLMEHFIPVAEQKIALLKCAAEIEKLKDSVRLVSDEVRQSAHQRVKWQANKDAHGERAGNHRPLDAERYADGENRSNAVPQVLEWQQRRAEARAERERTE